MARRVVTVYDSALTQSVHNIELKELHEREERGHKSHKDNTEEVLTHSQDSLQE